jgi:PilZ domain-containing protein
VFNELLKRLGSRKSERRSADRVRRRYPIGWIKNGTLIPGLGLEISEKGLLFASKESPAGAHADVALDLNGRRVRARLKIVRKGTMTRDGVEWAVIACVFEGIAADDWDAIVRFCKNLEDPSNKAAQELSALSGSDDDAYRLLPLKVQQRVVAVLIKAGRLAPGSDAKNPLLRMSYDGSTRAAEHRLAVHSRRSVEGEMLQFDSVLLVDDAGNVTLER